MWTSKDALEDWHMATYTTSTRKSGLQVAELCPKCGFHFTVIPRQPAVRRCSKMLKFRVFVPKILKQRYSYS